MKKLLIFLNLFFAILHVSAQTEAEKIKIREATDMKALNALSLKFQAEQDARLKRIKNQFIFPLTVTNKNGTFDQLYDIFNNVPIYLSINNVDAARSTRTNIINGAGFNLNGLGLTAHVWDGGAVLTTHQEFGGRVMVGDGVIALSGNSDHATHVTGTIAASGAYPVSKGMANKCNVKTHDWSNDIFEATQAAQNGMLVSNHSYGPRNTSSDWMWGCYIDISSNWDALMYAAPHYLMVCAAGNKGVVHPTNNPTLNSVPLNGSVGFDHLGYLATCKNNLAVANANDYNPSAGPSTISIVPSSSQGPTDDLRIKPDITGNGSQLISPIGIYTLAVTDPNYNSYYGNSTGTSMASPNVTGSLLLLQEHYKNLHGNYMRSATLKGLALHTAVDAGAGLSGLQGMTGPDAIYGWGYLDVEAAANAISQSGSSSIVDERTLDTNGSYSITVNSDMVTPLRASISWTDPAGTPNGSYSSAGILNDPTPRLVNDLDIQITYVNPLNGLTYVYNPWKLTSANSNTTGDNQSDPFERIDISAPTYSVFPSYVITVTHKGSLAGGLPQKYTLIVTGISSTCIPTAHTVPPNFAYNTPLVECNQWITTTPGVGSTDAVIIAPFASVKWDAHPVAGYVQLNPGFTATAGGTGQFIAQAKDGCGPQVPLRVKQTESNESSADLSDISGVKHFMRGDIPLNSSSNAFSLYPNPASTYLTLSNTHLLSEQLDIEILSMDNKVIRVIRDISFKTNYEFSVNDLSSGLYLIKVHTAKGAETLKFIKQ